MRSFALSSLIPLAFGIFAPAAPTIDVDVDVGGAGGGSGGGSPGNTLKSLFHLINATIDGCSVGNGGSGGPGGISALVGVGLRRKYSGGGSDGGLFDSDDGDPSDIGTLAGADLRPDGKESLESILCSVVSSADALVDKNCQSFPPSFLSCSLPSLLSHPRRRRVYCANLAPRSHRGQGCPQRCHQPSQRSQESRCRDYLEQRRWCLGRHRPR